MSRHGSGVRIEHECDPLEPGRDLREQLKPLSCQRGFVAGEAGDVPTRAVEARDDAGGDGVGPAQKDDWDRSRLRWTAAVAGVQLVKMMSGFSPTNSCASAGIRLMSLVNRRRSIRTLRPSVQPKPASA